MVVRETEVTFRKEIKQLGVESKAAERSRSKYVACGRHFEGGAGIQSGGINICGATMTEGSIGT